ncbi:MAG: hypothetical protein QXJ45_07940 [Thermoproteota archaeon]
MSRVFEWKCEYCGREFKFVDREEMEFFMTIHRELHEVIEELGIKITWDKEKQRYRAFSIETGEELASTRDIPENSMLI